MFHNYLTNESRRYNIQNLNNNNISKKDIMPKYTNINKEIKKRTNDIRNYYNIKNTIFKEMQSKQNSLTYKELLSYLGKHFFGPVGVVTEKYKFLRDYYEEQNLKLSNNRIYAGTLDYFFLLSKYNSMSQRLNFTKEKLLSLSNNLAIASSAFDKVNQKAIHRFHYQKKKKNYVYLNIKNSFSAGSNLKNIIKNININKEINKENSQIKNDKKILNLIINKNNESNYNNSKSFSDNNETTTINKNDENTNIFNSGNNSFIKTKVNIYNNTFNLNKGKEKIFYSKENEKNYKNLKLKLKKMENKYLLNHTPINITPDTSISNIQHNSSFFNNTNIYSYKNKSKINILKHKIDSIKIPNKLNDKTNIVSCSFPKINSVDDIKKNSTEQKKFKESLSSFCLNNNKITNALDEVINPILFLNKNSFKKLSYIKKHLKSKNDRKIKKIMNKKEILGVLKDKEYYKNIKNLKTSRHGSIELPNKIKNYFEY